MAKNKMVRFNIKNVKYAVKDPSTGEYGTVKDLAYARVLTLEPNLNETVLYGDGSVIGTLVDDKGKTGSLGVINVEEAFEIDCGRAMMIEGGFADIQVRKNVELAIFYEVEVFEEGAVVTLKNWLFRVVTGRSNESYNQTEDNPNISSFEYPITVFGETLLASGGATEYEDENGNTLQVFRQTVWPEDDVYDTFEDEVPEPEVASE
jgi:hypothetical protein